MNLSKRKSIVFLALLLFGITVLAACGGDTMRPEKELQNFSDIIEEGNLDDLSLTIHYINPTILTRYPLSVENLLNYSGVVKVVIKGKDLEEHIGLFNNVTNTALKSVRKKSYVDARIYYVFETEESVNILDVILWGENNSMFVNGVEIKENAVFYSIIKPFLPEDIQTHLSNGK